ncbi:MAG: UDP-2,3-diacylglucosamine hydrolase [Granulosicoccus sp.]|jgi:UDP-2,3-diacylglucosamine hydrolase
MIRNKVYFASDFHLGVPNKEYSDKREKAICKWLDMAAQDASDIYLHGDLFDFWYEYGSAVPKGFVRFQGKLAEVADSGINIHVFTGNHDMWMFNYFEEELGVKMYRKPISFNIHNLKVFIGHGDGLGPGDHRYKLIKKVFSNPLCIFLFRWIHPDIGISIANFWSRRSRNSNLPKDEIYRGDENEYLVQFCNDHLKNEKIDLFIFGHRHLVLDMKIGNDSRYVNTGAWFKDPHYLVIDESGANLKEWEL